MTAGAGDEPTQRYTASMTVLESPDHGPELCFGVDESFPPQCSGPDVVGWDWAEVHDEESANGTTWGDYTVVGTWDGDRLTLTEPPGPPSPSRRGASDFPTPCEPPPDGWAVIDPAKTTGEAQNDALQHASGQPDFGGAWIDQSVSPASTEDQADEMAMNDPTRLVLNLRFTGDIAHHEAEIREIWGGALCVSEAARPLAELRALQDELHGELDARWSAVSEVDGVVEIGVMVVDPELQASLDERYGEGTVDVSGVLEPVS